MIKIALIGAGSRGTIYTNYALKRPMELQVVAVAEPLAERREKIAGLHHISSEHQYADWKSLLAGPKVADVIFLCTQDDMHYEPTMEALAKGYHVFVEKPMSPKPHECMQMAEEAEKRGLLLMVGHVLRYTSYFTMVKQVMEEKRIGRPVTIQWNENVGYWHQAHSFVRGNWRNSETSSPMILAKCCHDLDLLQWLIDAECTRLSSFGGLTYFNKENAPDGAADRCVDCKMESNCEYSALKWYYNTSDKWPQNTVSHEPTLAARLKALQEGPYGKCVWKTDNNVVDHQVVNLEFANDTKVAFTMTAFSKNGGRAFRIQGTKGEIIGHLERNDIEILYYSGKRETISAQTLEGGHSGGDLGIMTDFVRVMNTGGKEGLKTSGTVSAQSHMLAFAAEHARLTGTVVDLKEFVKEIKGG